MKNRTIVAAAICLAAAMAGPGGASAQTVQELVGPWDATINAAGQEIGARLLVGIENGEPTVTVSTPQGDQPAENVSYENNVLAFTISFGPAQLDIALTVDGETFTGAADSPFGPVTITGNKVSEEELERIRNELEPLVGDWDIYTEFEGQQLDSKFRVTMRDNRLFGANMGGGGGGDIDADEFIPLRVEGDSLQWRVAIPYVTQRGGFVRVTLDRESMEFEGTVRSSLGEVPIRGKYVDTTKLVQTPYDDPAPIIGDWALEVELGGQATPATMTIEEIENRLHATLNADIGVYKSNSVEWKAVGDRMGSMRIEAEIPPLSPETLTFEFIVDRQEDTLTGEEIFGNTDMFITGERASETPGATIADESEGVTPQAVMDMLDANKDGKITQEEAPDQLKQFFTMVDANGDGGIDVTEAQTIADFMNAQ